MLFPNEEEDDEEKSGMERDGNRSEFSFPCASPAQTAMYWSWLTDVIWRIKWWASLSSYRQRRIISWAVTGPSSNSASSTAPQPTGPFPVSSGTDSRQWRQPAKVPWFAHWILWHLQHVSSIFFFLCCLSCFVVVVTHSFTLDPFDPSQK